MIKLISNLMAGYLCSDESNKENYALYEYAVYVVLSSVFHIVTTLVIGICFNLIIESIVFYFSFIIIRKFAGGYHASTPTRCYLFSVILTILVLFLLRLLILYDNLYLRTLDIILKIVCIIVISIFSPLDTENNPLSVQEKRIYKRISILLSVIVSACSVMMITFEVGFIGYPMSFGVFVSAFVLTMRKIQIAKKKTKQ